MNPLSRTRDAARCRSNKIVDRLCAATDFCRPEQVALLRAWQAAFRAGDQGEQRLIERYVLGYL